MLDRPRAFFEQAGPGGVHEDHLTRQMVPAGSERPSPPMLALTRWPAAGSLGASGPPA